jgi:hypothetical protein
MKRASVNQHKLFIESLLSQDDLEELDELDQLHELDFQPAQRRSGREIETLLSILDAIGKGGQP